MGKGHIIPADYTAEVRKVLFLTLALNSVVSLAKVFYGYITGSIAMTSDGVHSFFDGVSNVVGLVGIWIASHPPDKKHPYGHKKYETLFTIVIAVMIFASCYQILRRVYFSFSDHHSTIVTHTSFLVMIVTMAINSFVMWYEAKKGKELSSDFLIADAMHTKSDIFASIAVILSLVLTKIGLQHADTAVGVVITFFIARIGYKILKKSSDVLVDTVCISTRAIEDVVHKVNGVKGCHGIRTRGQMNAVYLDLHILVDRNLPTGDAHQLANNLENTIRKEFPSVIDIVVHVEPEDEHT
jgi:cation diffusion facilitator family transporter